MYVHGSSDDPYFSNDPALTMKGDINSVVCSRSYFITLQRDHLNFRIGIFFQNRFPSDLIFVSVAHSESFRTELISIQNIRFVLFQIMKFATEYHIEIDSSRQRNPLD